MSQRIGYDPATANHATPQYDLGLEFHEDGKRYRYVQFKDIGIVGISAGTVCGWSGTSGTAVTADVSASSAAAAGACAGIALATMTDDYYGFVQIGGFCNKIATDGTVVKTAGMVLGTDGVATASGASDTIPTFGMPLADDDATPEVTAAILFCN